MYKLLLLFAFMFSLTCMTFSQQANVEVIEKDDRVDIRIDGKPFTSYIWNPEIKKPALYPVLTSEGTPVTRGWPLDPRPYERMDHRHHVGIWLNFGNVNGLDFWNNSPDRRPERQHHYGTIIHKKVMDASSEEGRGELNTQMDWVDSKGNVLLEEVATFVFSGDKTTRIIDRVSTLTARDKIVFTDNKEGMYAIRLAREFEFPEDRPRKLTDTDGNPGQEEIVYNTGRNGAYLSSSGGEGKGVWGTQNDWIRLSTNIGDEKVSITIFDHPRNPTYPSYWHARSYGLFAINSLGRKVFDKSQEQLVVNLEKGESLTFRYRMVIHSGDIPSKEKLDVMFKTFGGDY